MKYLLPHRFKRIGAFLAPIGITLWLLMQLGFIERMLVSAFGPDKVKTVWSAYHIINIIVAVAGFFGFIAGLYFVSFSRERIEDEMVQKTRLDSFQFAAFVQIIFTIGGFFLMIFCGDPGEEGMMFFLIVLLFLFWLSFIGRFNYVLHIKYRA